MANDTRDVQNQILKIGDASKLTRAEVDRLVGSIERLNKVNFGGGSGGPTSAGGSNIPSGGKPKDYALRGMGFYTPQSAGSDVQNLNRFANAAKQAEQAIKQAYSEGAKSIEVFDRKIEATTGHVIVQAKVTRELQDAQGKAYGTQSFTATSRVDPFSGKQSQFTGAQQAFANQAGGIEKAQQALAKYGLQLQNVTGFYKDLNSNVARFSVVGTDGVAQAMGNMDQFGNATIHAARNAQTLAQNVTRNVEKVIEWAIATTLLYTVMNSLMQAGKELQDIEETMLDIQIATGAAGDELNRYYQAALDVANLTGSDVTETLEAQAKAYRAAGSEADRFGTANILLRDSMILSRIAGIDQSKALDTLVAALRQTGNELTEGTTLLDKWVATSKVIGVSVEDLAESFAITADVATTVGVTIDELNGIIGVLAEKTTLSGTEVGNAARTMFSGITSDEAVATLGEFGIAVRTVGGDMRDWMEINQDVVDMINAGILNDEQINKLANAMGGGSRRGPQLITLWRNFGAVSTVAGESMQANGDAADAMEIKLESLQAAINELHNAFNELVQTLGYDGGFLEMMTDIVKIASDVVRGLTDIADSFDDGAVSITKMVAGYMLLRKAMNTFGGSSGFNTLGAKGGTVNQGMMGLSGSSALGSGGFPGVGNYLGQTANPFSKQAAFQGIMGGGGAIALGEGLNAMQSGEDINTAGARVGATIAGAIVGNMILPGAGGVVGAFIADAFVREVQNRQDIYEEVARGDTASLSAAELQSKIDEISKGGIITTGTHLTGTQKDQFSQDEANQLLKEAIQSGAFQSAPAMGASGASRNLDTRTEFFQQRGFEEAEAKLLAQTYLSATALETLTALYPQLESAVKTETQTREDAAIAIPQTTLNQAALMQGPQGAALRQSFASQESSLYREASRTGNAEDYNKQTNAMKQIETATAAVANAQYGLNVTSEQYLEIGNLLLDSTAEQRDKIILYASAISDIQDKIEELKKNPPFAGAAQILQAYEAQLKQLGIEFEHVIELSKQAAAIQFARDTYISPTQVPTDQNGKPLTKEQSGFYNALAEQRQNQADYAEFQGIGPEALKASVTDPIVFAFADGYVQVEGLTADFAKGLMDDMKEAAEAIKEEISFAFKDMRDVNIDPGQLDQKIKYYENIMKQYEPYGYEEKKQNIGILGEGNQVRVLNTTMTALNLAIEDLTEVEKKQLEGQWNLPSGATAYVPISSLFAQTAGSGGAGGNPGIGESTGVLIDQGANKIDMAADKMLSAADAMKVRDLNSSRWEGLGAQYAKNAETKPTEVDVNTQVNITPAQVLLNLDGRIVANQLQQYLSEQLSNVSRTTPGGGPKII